MPGIDSGTLESPQSYIAYSGPKGLFIVQRDVTRKGLHMRRMDRRGFLSATGQAAAIGFGLAAAQGAASEARKNVDPADPHAPKTGRLLKEDETIGIGVIGLGLMGGAFHIGDLCDREKNGEKLQLRAVCDVYTRRRKAAQDHGKSATGHDVAAYANYKELLARDDIQGVVIATPDHWHAQITLDALEAGKDVYCQKPLTYTIEEALVVRDKVWETGRVLQCGAQGCSDDSFWQARDFIKKGGIGKVLWAQGEFSRNSAGGLDDRGGEWNERMDEDATDLPSGGDGYIDWAQWLGPAPQRPFSKPRFFQFRKFWDYSGGVATDLLYHLLAPLHIVLDAQAPERAVASGGIFIQHDDREVPDTFTMNLDYPDDYTVVLTSCLANRYATPLHIRGHKATIFFDQGTGAKVTAEEEFRGWFVKEFGAPEIILSQLPQSPAPTKPRPDHVLNWLECMRTRDLPTLDADTAYRSMAGIRMATDAYRSEKAVFWDGRKECYVNEHPRPDRTSKLPTDKA